MDVHIAPHTLQRAEERGVTMAEIVEVLRSGTERGEAWPALQVGRI